MNTDKSAEARWFADEVQPHEQALRAYLHARFPSLDDQDDIVQETYLRLLRIRATTGIRSARAFLFTTARNAATDFFRRRRVIFHDPVTVFGGSSVLEDSLDAAEACCQRQELEILADAIQTLPERCRQVILLRYLDGLPCKEIAARLGISPETVKVHLARGMRRCTLYFRVVNAGPDAPAP